MIDCAMRQACVALLHEFCHFNAKECKLFHQNKRCPRSWLVWRNTNKLEHFVPLCQNTNEYSQTFLCHLSQTSCMSLQTHLLSCCEASGCLNQSDKLQHAFKNWSAVVKYKNLPKLNNKTLVPYMGDKTWKSALLDALQVGEIMVKCPLFNITPPASVARYGERNKQVGRWKQAQNKLLLRLW